MVVITFWNIDNRDGSRGAAIASSLAQLTLDTKCDVLVVAEGGDAHVGLESLLQAACDPGFRQMTCLPCHLHVWTRLSGTTIQPFGSDPKRYEAYKLLSPGRDPALLVFPHLRSKVGRIDGREFSDTQEFVADLRKLESRQGPGAGTLVLGDLNLNPYDSAMRSPDAFNSSASREAVAAFPARRFRGKVYRAFYNPAWNLFGDANGPPGTYYWDSKNKDKEGWYVLDQVLLRPELISRFDLPSLRAVVAIGTDALLVSGGKLNPRWPDHLPITFQLD